MVFQCKIYHSIEKRAFKCFVASFGCRFVNDIPRITTNNFQYTGIICWHVFQRHISRFLGIKCQHVFLITYNIFLPGTRHILRPNTRSSLPLPIKMVFLQFWCSWTLVFLLNCLDLERVQNRLSAVGILGLFLEFHARWTFCRTEHHPTLAWFYLEFFFLRKLKFYFQKTVVKPNKLSVILQSWPQALQQ